MPIDETSGPEQVYLGEADVAVLAAVVGHPYQLPSIDEIRFVTREHDDDLVDRRVRRLVQQDVLEKVTFEDGPPLPDLPATFFGTTAFGDSILERRLTPDREHRLFENYARLEKPDRIRSFERAPRPPR